MDKARSTAQQSLRKCVVVRAGAVPYTSRPGLLLYAVGAVSSRTVTPSMPRQAYLLEGKLPRDRDHSCDGRHDAYSTQAFGVDCGLGVDISSVSHIYIDNDLAGHPRRGELTPAGHDQY